MNFNVNVRFNWIRSSEQVASATDQLWSGCRTASLTVGITDRARFVTLILQPDEDSETRWHLMTAWDSSARQIDAYTKRR